eukprot:GHRR01022714.1.p1 GENE.GHRR01022714.1~~GHRR01022714.1.p1  ORF type:complete len:163 (+),score=44.22 GHRR01022714.1:424-912(+)
MKLFTQINTYPTLFEVITGRAQDPGLPKKAAAGSAAKPQANKRKQENPAMPAAYPQPTAAVATGSKQPSPGTRRLMHQDVSPMLTGAMAELFWPDDGLWYPVRIEQLDSGSRKAKIVYLPGLEEEDLEMDDIIRDGHMMLLPQQPRPGPAHMMMQAQQSRPF